MKGRLKEEELLSYKIIVLKDYTFQFFHHSHYLLVLLHGKNKTKPSTKKQTKNPSPSEKDSKTSLSSLF